MCLYRYLILKVSDSIFFVKRLETKFLLIYCWDREFIRCKSCRLFVAVRIGTQLSRTIIVYSSELEM